MMETAVSMGLCGSCANASTCKYRTNAGQRPIVFCEEFQVEILSRGKQRIPESHRDESANEAEVKNLGLCFDCKNRENCALSTRAEGGVWYCEEYI